ncbi:hypothetical protein PAAG_12564 [Paracoccidioides lutzii Pb01]|uniref:Uncharacterized protein n=1 Tax=Paracoccidioides lutzii (strain ATCC MYA-826 / Pb01) TaxID=502779 RepID=A0A0A2VIM8_PARBA|nr:hypothetical protein PAAG_12564 [Paracoccidioides lutzii Pb01]KGQ00769.1 hypothetical protein PAAG_12564 [Paracoccidioides lutzii Pb01]
MAFRVWTVGYTMSETLGECRLVSAMNIQADFDSNSAPTCNMILAWDARELARQPTTDTAISAGESQGSIIAQDSACAPGT